MITKLTYKFFNYKKLLLLFVISFLQYTLFRLPINNPNLNINVLSQINFKEPLTSLNGICPMFVNTGLIYFVITTIVEVIRKNCILICTVPTSNEKEIFVMHLHNINYSNNRLDTSNPFLYSNKQVALLE